MILGLQLALTILLAAMLLFLSAIDSAVDELSEVQLRVLLAEHEQGLRGRLLKEIVEATQRFLVVLGFCSQILIVSITILTSTVFDQWAATRAGALLWALLTVLVIVGLFRQLVPRLVTQHDPARVLLFLLPTLSVFYGGLQTIAYPIYRVIQYRQQKLDETEGEVEDEDEDIEDEIQAFIDVGEEEGIIEEAEGQLIQSIVELGDRRVTEIMTPRAEIVAVRGDLSVLEAINAILDSRYSRAPVYREHLDDIVGVVSIRDLFKRWREGRADEPVSKMARTAYYVPETKLAGELLEEMRRSHTHIALVIDEFGGIAGLITIEDLLEEIIGEIEEEQAKVDDDMIKEPDGGYLVKGSLEIRKIEEIFQTEIEADDFTTIAGLMIRELKHLPAIGEQLQFRNLLFEVVDADPRRILEVRVRPIPVTRQPSENLSL